jgi:hypothetical protein
MKSEAELQQAIVVWFNNNYCLKSFENRGLIFAIPNGGTRNIREAMTLKATGTLKGASDIVVIFPNGKICFIELKLAKGKQSPEQIDFQNRITKAGYEYHLIRCLESFQELTKINL